MLALALRARDLLATARPRQWLKNAVVFAPLVFGLKLFEGQAVVDAALAFLAFCAAGSAIYFFNDWCDAAADREHPLKRLRPIAAGRLGRGSVWAAIVALSCAALLFAALAGGGTLFVVLGYGVLMIAYTLRLKHVALLDIFTIAGGFVLRVWAGATAVGVPLSPWLYVCTVLLALFLAVAKRRHEALLLEGLAGNHRPALDEYPVPLLEALLHVTATASIMAYALYTFFAPSLPEDHSMMFTIPFVLYGIFRYLYLVYRRDLGGVPEQVLLDDRPLLVTIVAWGILVLALLYR
ncbi:MAG: decaprenyl-phosphate phosphoribosyltransferase [Thermomicrobium sp.]|nr:decaprenyl-phosphate phosphoribosyltransferase [Thermomicrobium sp.]